MVKKAMAIESEIEDARSIRDTIVSGKRKEDQPSSSFGKEVEDLYPMRISRTGSWLSRPRPTSASSQSGPMTCFHCHQPRHVR